MKSHPIYNRNHHERKAAKLSSFGLMLASLLTISIAGTCSAADGSGSNDANLSKLEQKFFQHSYAKDPLATRLERLEKMIFGEAKQGAEQQRLANLVQAVPNLSEDDGSANKTASTAPASSSSERPSGGGQQPANTQRKVAETPQREKSDVPSGTKYPAVSAIEAKLFNKDFGNESIDSRLARLEMKVFNKQSKSDDLSDRVDKLKTATGIDIAALPPQNSDWDDEDTFMPPSKPAPRSSGPTYTSPDGEDGKSFSGRDLRQDMKRAFPAYGAMGKGPSASGSYGMGGGGSYSSSGSGSYGMGGGGSYSSSSGSYGLGGGNASPKTAPQRTLAPMGGAPNMVASAPNGMGLNQQVTSLETEIFGKSYGKDPLPARLNRIEQTVFPNEKPYVEKTLPERVNRLLAVIPLSGQGNLPRVAQKSGDDLDDLDLDADIPQPAPQRGGLGKIINSLGNMLGGGAGFAMGGYPTAGGLRTDPQTGLLMDGYGSLIDPSTGQVVGRRVAPPYAGQRYGVPGMPISPYPSFNNGFSPMMPGMGMNMGGMGSGINFGVGGMGRSFGGMWP